MKRADARLLGRYAAARKLRLKLLKRRWKALQADDRRRLAVEMLKKLARIEADEAHRRANAAFERLKEADHA
jgi:hypothetical protein